ncbi:MAG TPA: tetratricopeptide repeat protein, partial [Pirellulales bacterium]
MPIDLILFVVESHIAAGGDENFERAEDVLRGWLVKFSEAPELEADVKASVQLLLAKNYFKAQRYDVARSEYTTVINRYAGTPQAIEAEFGVGECFMAQKVYDQAESIFTKLATSSERDVVVRAEFLRGVLANRRGDADEARDIFRKVLDMVPSVDLANQALFNLSEVYGAEQRYMDQLELLRTVGRLGRASKRWHNPGTALSIVVQDGDLGVSRGHARIPVRVVTLPGGDEETVYLYSGGAGKGLFRADLETRLGQVAKNDKVLQLTGNDVIRCDYPDEFKAEFRSVPLADAEIRIAANADFEAASGKIIDLDKETLSERLEREAREKAEADQRVSQDRPANQIKPGNSIYMRVKDADRDLSDEADSVIVKLVAGSGDQVQLTLKENGPHTGIFEGQATTGELPAGALASDTSIDHSPLMAIDRDPSSFWLSEPDGATPKWLAVDMKDLKVVDKVVVTTPNPTDHAPVQLDLQGSHDGRYWFRLASVPPVEAMEPLNFQPGPMSIHVYPGNFTNFSNWKQVVEMCKNRQETESSPVQTISWKRPEDADDAKSPYAAVWTGKLVAGKAGAARIRVQGQCTALAIDGVLELSPDKGDRTADVWLEAGSHDVVIFSATTQAQREIGATWSKEDYRNDQIVFAPFRAADFDLTRPDAEPAPPKAAPTVEATEGKWTFGIPATSLRHTRLFVREYRGEAVAINHVEVFGPESDAPYIPTKDDVLGLADNQILEIAAGDDIVASYTDEFTQSGAGKTQLLLQKLQATFFNGTVTPINYEFIRNQNGNVYEERKQVARVEPGERFIVEIVDYDHDTSAAPDLVNF